MKYIYLMLIILHIHIRVLYRNTLQLYFWHTNLVQAYLMPAKLEQLILYLIHFNCAEVGLKSN